MPGSEAPRFGWTEEWPTASLGEIAAIHGGSTPSRSVPSYWSGEIAWVTPGELTNLKAKYLTETQDRITPAGLASCAASLVPEGSLLVTTRATLGAVALAAMPVATNQGFRSLVFNGAADPHFFYHLATRLVPEFIRRASGTTFLEVSGREFAAVAVPLPPLAEQRRVAEILDTIDEAIRKTEEVIEKLQEVKQGLLHDLMTRGIDENGELRDPERHPEQFKGSALGFIPRNWGLGVLDDAIDPSRPVVYGILMPGNHVPSGVPVVKVKDIFDDRINEGELLHTSPAIDREYRRSRLHSGDLLFTIRGTVGRMAFVPDSLEGANITQDTARLSLTRADPRFVRHYICMPLPRRFIETHTIGQAVRGINLRELRQVPLALPPRAEQERIAGLLEQTSQRITQEMQVARKLGLLKQGLVHDLLTGHVRVPVLEGVSV